MTTAPEPRRDPDLDEIPVPDVSGLITEDGAPVDNLFSEKQMRLLTEPLHSSWHPPDGGRFFLAANVGVFATASNDTLVPDVFLSLDTAPRHPLSEKRNRSYFLWEHGKPPDVVIEIVSNTEGEELTRRLRGYERMRIGHYVVFDPWHLLSAETVMRFELHVDTLVQVPEPFLLPRVGLGLTLVQGSYEGEEAEWLRWCLADGTLVPTGAERAEAEAQRAEAEAQRADRLAAKLRALGIDLDD